MTVAVVHTLRPGDHVVARDAFNKLLAAVIAPVPRDWRDTSGSETWTTRGAFPKVWVRFKANGHIVPWPIEDVFTNMDDAKERVAEIDTGWPT